MIANQGEEVIVDFEVLFDQMLFVKRLDGSTEPFNL